MSFRDSTNQGHGPESIPQLKKFVRTFRQYRDVTLTLAGQTITASQPIPSDEADILAKINNSDAH